MWGKNVRIFTMTPHGEIYGIIMTQTQGVEIGGGGMETYVVSFPQVFKSVTCVLEGCPAREHNPGRLRDHFMDRHWKSKSQSYRRS